MKTKNILWENVLRIARQWKMKWYPEFLELIETFWWVHNHSVRHCLSTSANVWITYAGCQVQWYLVNTATPHWWCWQFITYLLLSHHGKHIFSLLGVSCLQGIQLIPLLGHFVLQFLHPPLELLQRWLRCFGWLKCLCANFITAARLWSPVNNKKKTYSLEIAN